MFFAAAEPFGRLRGRSDILYIGSGIGEKRGHLRGRIKDYIDESQQGRMRFSDGDRSVIKVAVYYKDHPAITLGWKLRASECEALALETEWLRDYVRDHHETPPFNSQVGIETPKGIR